MSFYLGLIFMIGVPAFFMIKLFLGQQAQNALRGDTVIIKALVNGEKSYFGNSPVSRQYAYKYEFYIYGKKYSGDTRDPSKHPGDSIKVKYVVTKPETNEPLD